MGHDGWMQEVIHWLNQPELEADEMWEREGARYQVPCLGSGGGPGAGS